MTDKIVAKLTACQQRYLEQIGKQTAQARSEGYDEIERRVKANINGYLSALRDSGFISEHDRQVLWIYYATIYTGK